MDVSIFAYNIVSGHKYFIKCQIPIDACISKFTFYFFLQANKSSFRDQTYMKIKQNKFYMEI